jgi:hypothetical protein
MAAVFEQLMILAAIQQRKCHSEIQGSWLLLSIQPIKVARIRENISLYQQGIYLISEVKSPTW